MVRWRGERTRSALLAPRSPHPGRFCGRALLWRRTLPRDEHVRPLAVRARLRGRRRWRWRVPHRCRHCTPQRRRLLGRARGEPRVERARAGERLVTRVLGGDGELSPIWSDAVTAVCPRLWAGCEGGRVPASQSAPKGRWTKEEGQQWGGVLRDTIQSFSGTMLERLDFYLYRIFGVCDLSVRNSAIPLYLSLYVLLAIIVS